MSRVAFIAFLAALCAPVFGQTPGVPSKNILLGQSAAFTGPAAQLCIQMNIGTKAFLDYVNAWGGVYGRKIELKTRDDRYEATVCVEATKKLIEEDKVFTLISYVGTPTTGAALPILTRERLVAALESMNNVDLGEFVVNFSPASHSGSRFVDLTMIGRGGKFLK